MNQDQTSKLDKTYGLQLLKSKVEHFKPTKTKIENIKQNCQRSWQLGSNYGCKFVTELSCCRVEASLNKAFYDNCLCI